MTVVPSQSELGTGANRDTKAETERSFFSVFLLMSLLILTGAKFALHRVQDAEHAIEQNAPMRVVQKLFPDAESLAPGKDGGLYVVRDGSGETLGAVLHSGAVSDSIRGYGGPTPLIVGLSPVGKIIGVALLPNRESASFLEYLDEEGLFEAWNDLSPSKAIDVEVDAVSGATRSSSAIIRTVRSTLGGVAASCTEERGGGWLLPLNWREWLGWLGMMLGILLYRRIGLFAKYRLITLGCLVVLIGFIGGTSVSLAVYYGWITSGFPSDTFTPVVLTVGITVVLALLAGKNFYCTSLCPFGASQELMARIPGIRRRRVPRRIALLLTSVRGMLLALLLVAVFADRSPDPVYLEPFAVFQLKACPGPVLGFAGAFLLVSVFFPRFWCRYFCPTGYIFECLRGRCSRQDAVISRERVLAFTALAMLFLEVAKPWLARLF